MAGIKTMKAIYLDYHATTPLDSRVSDAMLSWMGDGDIQQFGNAHARHQFGINAANAVEHARGQIANALNCSRHSLLFTSGATEAANIALQGIMPHLKQQGRANIITLAGEHPAVLKTLQAIEKRGDCQLIYAPIDADGRVNMDALQHLLESENIGLVAIMHSHNEIGILQDIEAIAELAHNNGALLFSDMTQSLGKTPLDIKAMNVDMACFSAHKLYGPQGVGALYAKNMRLLQPVYHGGGQERSLRSGTLPIFLIVGFGEAVALATQSLPTEMARVQKLRDDLLQGLIALFPDIIVNGSMDYRLAGNLHLTFTQFSNEKLRDALPEIQFSSGSACSASDDASSNIINALQQAGDMAQKDTTKFGYMRLSVGRMTNDAQIADCLTLFETRLLK
ncbi:MAG: cysteine desulfurase [Alphaproteobacteria bacterium]|nr:cysteine desulfurase [Alphaproteobacteria bacterium]